MPEDGQIVRFRIGEAFPADDQLARWMTVLAMALNDLLIVNALVMPRLEEKVPTEAGETFYLGRVASAHLFEAATFLRKSDRIDTIKDFVGSLEDEAQSAYRGLLLIGDGGKGKFCEQLKHARNKSFHYQELFVGDHEDRERLKQALAGHAEDEREKGISQGEIRDIPPALTGFRANFAYDVASEMMLPEDTEAEHPAFLENVRLHINEFAILAKAALSAYAETKPAETWEVERVEARADFVGLLGDLQALVGQEIRGQVIVNDHFFGLGFQASLHRVETLPDSEAITILFSNGVSVDLAPNEQQATPVEDGLELRLGAHLALLLSPAEE